MLLRQAIRSIEEQIEERAGASGQLIALEVASKRDLSKVFVVHGHDEAALQAVTRFIEHLRLEAVVLREQPDQGRTIIENLRNVPVQ